MSADDEIETQTFACSRHDNYDKHNGKKNMCVPLNNPPCRKHKLCPR